MISAKRIGFLDLMKYPTDHNILTSLKVTLRLSMFIDVSENNVRIKALFLFLPLACDTVKPIIILDAVLAYAEYVRATTNSSAIRSCHYT